jgi:hypothetical protein
VGRPAALACPMEDEPMIYEVRTYTLRPGGAVAEFEERFAKRLPLREGVIALFPTQTC